MSRVVDLLHTFTRLSVVVVGETMLDRYIEGRCERMCQEAPVPVVAVADRQHRPGGAANTAVNVATLGGRATLVSLVGDDAEADETLRFLAELGVDTSSVVRAEKRRTLGKSRVVADSQVVVRFDEGDTGPPDATAQQRLIAGLRSAWRRCDAVILSDYRYGVLSASVIAELVSLQRRNPKLIVADSKDLTLYRELAPAAVKPNHAQAAAIVEVSADDASTRIQAIAERADRLLERTGARMAAVTFDRDGALFLESGHEPYRTYARPEKSARAAGGGDTFAAALTLALAAGADVPTAGELASGAAAEVVAQDGTAACTISDIRERFAPTGKYVRDPHRLARRLAELRRRGQRVVFTNGCFDIIHRGHVAYLSRAKSLGDVLVVGINTDAGVARLKGPERPVNPLSDRVEVLTALSCVDHVVPFDSDTPVELIRVLCPHVFVKGGDYELDALPEKPVVEELGGSVMILPYVEDRSTTSMIERIRRSSGGERTALKEASHA